MVLDFKVNRKIDCRDDNQFFYTPILPSGRGAGESSSKLILGHRQTSVDEFLRFSRKCGIDGT